MENKNAWIIDENGNIATKIYEPNAKYANWDGSKSEFSVVTLITPISFGIIATDWDTEEYGNIGEKFGQAEAIVLTFGKQKRTLRCTYTHFGERYMYVTLPVDYFGRLYGSPKKLMDALEGISGDATLTIEESRPSGKNKLVISLPCMDELPKLLKTVESSWAEQRKQEYKRYQETEKKDIVDFIKETGNVGMWFQVIMSMPTVIYYMKRRKQAILIERGASEDDDFIYHNIMDTFAIEHSLSPIEVQQRPYIQLWAQNEDRV